MRLWKHERRLRQYLRLLNALPQRSQEAIRDELLRVLHHHRTRVDGGSSSSSSSSGGSGGSGGSSSSGEEVVVVAAAAAAAEGGGMSGGLVPREVLLMLGKDTEERLDLAGLTVPGPAFEQLVARAAPTLRSINLCVPCLRPCPCLCLRLCLCLWRACVRSFV